MCKYIIIFLFSRVICYFENTNLYGVDDDLNVFKNATNTNKWNYTIYIYYLKLLDVDEPSEKVSFAIELMELWYDSRLSWNASEYHDIKTMYVRQETVWSPTLSAFGAGNIQDFRDPDFRQVSVSYIGKLYTYIPLVISVNCPLHLAKFPFDEQTCLIRFSLPIYYSREIRIFTEIYNVILKQQQLAAMGNSEWKVTNLSGKTDVVRYGDGISDIELATLEIKLRRNPMYYFYMIILPSYIINTVSIFGVFLKSAEKMSKLNVGITTMMTMTFILGIMANSIPATSVIPLLGIYIIINLSIMIVSLAIIAFIGRFRIAVIDYVEQSKNKHSCQIKWFVGQPLETLLVCILHVINAINFSVMIIIWIST